MIETGLKDKPEEMCTQYKERKKTIQEREKTILDILKQQMTKSFSTTKLT